MEILITAEEFEAAFATLKNFVHRPGSDSSMLTMAATHMTADKDAGTVTFVGNNPSQKISFAIEAEVAEAGEALVSVADVLTALSTIADKTQKVRVSLEDNDLGIHSKRVSVNVPVFDIKGASVRPRAPKIAAGNALSISIDAESLPVLFARASSPAMGESRMPKILMWVEEGEFCLMSLSDIGVSFASASGAKASGESDLVLWDAGNLRRIVGLAASADEIKFSQDANADGVLAPEFTVTVKGKDCTFTIEQVLEEVHVSYRDAREKLSARAVSTLNTSVTSVTVKGSDISRAMESAEKVRVLGRDKANGLTTFLSISSGLLSVALEDETFSEEIDSAKTDGTLPRSVGVNAKMTLAMLAALGPDAKVTLHLPPEDPSGRTSFAAVTCQDSNTASRVESLPATGFWGLTSFRADAR